ncbi:MAG: hypothetical protein ACR2QF_12225 [Geminicoccaceae bacterium]
MNAVWAGARALFESEKATTGGLLSWDKINDEAKEVYRVHASEVINAYEAALNQPMRKALKDGRHVLGWNQNIGMWCTVRCVAGEKWPDGFTKWRPMPAPIKEGAS